MPWIRPFLGSEHSTPCEELANLSEEGGVHRVGMVGRRAIKFGEVMSRRGTRALSPENRNRGVGPLSSPTPTSSLLPHKLAMTDDRGDAAMQRDGE